MPNGSVDADGAYVDTIAVGDDLHLVLPSDTTAHFGNHACEPSMWPQGAYEFATMRPVERDRWLLHMRSAVATMAPPDDVRTALLDYFEMAAESMRNSD